MGKLDLYAISVCPRFLKAKLCSETQIEFTRGSGLPRLDSRHSISWIRASCVSFGQLHFLKSLK